MESVERGRYDGDGGDGDDFLDSSSTTHQRLRVMLHAFGNVRTSAT